MLCKHSTSKINLSIYPIYLSISHRSLLSALEAHYRDPANPYPGAKDDDNSLMFELTPYLETAGLSDPLSKVLKLY